MIIDGKAIAKEIETEVATVIRHVGGRQPCLVVVLVGSHGPSQVYVSKKIKACERVGILSECQELPVDITEAELLGKINTLNANARVDGILVQLPLPEHIDTDKVINTISPDKDVDGFHPINLGKLLIGKGDPFAPCTPLGVHYMLQHEGVDPSGKRVVILGRSNIVGKPMAAILMQNAPACNATVTIAHSRTPNMEALCREADILIAAVGKAQMVTADMVKEGAVVIDVGMNQLPDSTKKLGYRLVGDVDFDAVKEKASKITPVPGGVGPMTIAMLMRNTLQSYRRREGIVAIPQLR